MWSWLQVSKVRKSWNTKAFFGDLKLEVICGTAAGMADQELPKWCCCIETMRTLGEKMVKINFYKNYGNNQKLVTIRNIFVQEKLLNLGKNVIFPFSHPSSEITLKTNGFSIMVKNSSLAAAGGNSTRLAHPKSIIFRELSLFGLSGTYLKIFLIMLIFIWPNSEISHYKHLFSECICPKKKKKQQSLIIATVCDSDNIWD